MQTAVGTLFSPLVPNNKFMVSTLSTAYFSHQVNHVTVQSKAASQIFKLEQSANVIIPHLYCRRSCFPLKLVDKTPPFRERVCAQIGTVQAVSSGLEDVGVSSSEYEKFSVITSKNEINKLKISVEVFGATTQEIFDDVFSKMVAAAQPIPGFRRVKGGKTPDIPRDILLEVLGPSKVYKEVIKKVINYTISEYIRKEKLTVSKNLRVAQSLEDLEATFEPGDGFKFDAIVQCRGSN